MAVGKGLEVMTLSATDSSSFWKQLNAFSVEVYQITALPTGAYGCREVVLEGLSKLLHYDDFCNENNPNSIQFNPPFGATLHLVPYLCQGLHTLYNRANTLYHF